MKLHAVKFMSGELCLSDEAVGDAIPVVDGARRSAPQQAVAALGCIQG